MPFEDAPELPDWIERSFPFRRRMHVLDGERLHFVDEGEGPTVLLVHGNPMWSFLWRHIIPPLLQAGFRVLAPDLLGFGWSTKLKHPSDHTFQRHLDRLCAWIDALDVRDLTVVGQDWGGAMAGGIGLMRPERVGAAVFGNTSVLRPRRPFKPQAFHRFSHMPIVSDVAFRGMLFPFQVLPFVQGSFRTLSPAVLAAYAYPFRGRGRAGPLGLARMVADHEDHPSTRLQESIGMWSETFDGPVGLIWGQKDPILGRGLKAHRKVFDQAPFVATQAGHFLQEEVPDAFADMIVKTAGRLQSRKKSSISS